MVLFHRGTSLVGEGVGGSFLQSESSSNA